MSFIKSTLLLAILLFILCISNNSNAWSVKPGDKGKWDDLLAKLHVAYDTVKQRRQMDDDARPVFVDAKNGDDVQMPEDIETQVVRNLISRLRYKWTEMKPKFDDDFEKALLRLKEKLQKILNAPVSRDDENDELAIWKNSRLPAFIDAIRKYIDSPQEVQLADEQAELEEADMRPIFRVVDEDEDELCMCFHYPCNCGRQAIDDDDEQDEEVLYTVLAALKDAELPPQPKFFFRGRYM